MSENKPKAKRRLKNKEQFKKMALNEDYRCKSRSIRIKHRDERKIK